MSLRAELITERTNLLKDRERIDARLSAIDILLADDVDSEARPRRERGRPRKAITVTLPPGSGKTAVVAGLRALLRVTLQPGQFAKPADVIEAVQRKGFVATGKTPINFRVYNELKRMRREGELERDEQGRYALKAS